MLQQPPPRAKRARTTRRTFLIGTGAVLGIGVGFLLWPREWKAPSLAADGEVPLNAWVRVAPDGQVILAIPQAEMGQGAWSGLAQILADELGADWQRVAVEPAPLHPAYAHVGMVRQGTAGLPPMIRDLAALAGTNVVRTMNLQLTGGSTSIKGYHDIVREAGAAARAMIVGAAARAWGVNMAEVDTRDGFAIFQANRMPFADAVKGVDPADARRAVLRPAGTGGLMGKAVPRLDLPPKVDGTARFGADVRVPGMLFAAIAHGPVGNGRLVSVRGPEGARVVKGGNWVAATGETTFEAMRALERLTIDWETDGEPAGDWIDDAIAEALNGEGGKAVARSGWREEALGDTPLVADYSVPFLAHACMEPMTATCRIEEGRVELWGPTQSLTLATMAVADALGVDRSAITVHPTLLGGGFGRKAETDHFVKAALIAQAIGRPVQLQFSRTEDLHADMFRPAGAARMRARLDDDRRIAALDARVAIPNVGASAMARYLPRLAPSPTSASASAIEGVDRIAYAVPAFRATHVPVVTAVPLGFWRSVGHSFSAFFVESFMDELAEAAGVDPVTFRMRHLADRPRHAAVLKAVAEDSRFRDPSPEGFAKGVALHESFGSIVALVVEAGVRDGAIQLRRAWAAVDCGRAINPDSVRAQIEGGALFGLCAAIHGEIRFEDGFASQKNFDGYRLLAMADAPAFSVRILESGAPLGGIGEPGTPPAAPALANALAAATGTRARNLPLAEAFA
ncbi:MAG: molybdopterin cofactor-binding domain-containing protein [Sphingomonadaceae bacterium]